MTDQLPVIAGKQTAIGLNQTTRDSDGSPWYIFDAAHEGSDVEWCDYLGHDGVWHFNAAEYWPTREAAIEFLRSLAQPVAVKERLAASDEGVESLRQLVLSQFDRLQWRHHGIGVLQAYLFEHSEPEARVHVWHPSLAREGISESGDCHDHRFDLRSTILAGCLEETYFGYPTPSETGDWAMYVVENARAAGPDKQFDGACNPLPGRFAATQTNHRYPAGATYTHPRGTFHRTRVGGLAVTLCLMSKKEGRARLLVPFGREPVHAFGEPASADVQDRILAEAKAMLVAQSDTNFRGPLVPQQKESV